MTTFYAFFRLFWRWITVFWFLFVLGFTAKVLAKGETDVVLIVLPAMLGFLAGQVVKELQQLWFATTLPGLNPGLSRVLILVGIVASALTTFLYRPGGDPLTLLAIFSLGLLTFALGAFFNRFAFIALAALIVFKNRLLGEPAPLLLDGVYPVGLAVLAMGALVYLLRHFGAGGARGRPFENILPFWGGTRRELEWMREGVLRKNGRTKDWSVARVGMRTIDWIRAANHENNGHHRFGWLVGKSMVPVFMAGFLLWDVYEARDLIPNDPGWADQVLQIFDSSAGTAAYLGLSIAVSVLAIVWFGPLSLRLRALYPASRRHLARMAYRTDLFEGLVVCGFVAMIFLLVGSIPFLLYGLPESWHPSPGLVRPVALSFLFLPGVQWIRFRYWVAGCSKPSAAMMLATLPIYMATVTVFSSLWAKHLPELLDPRVLGILVILLAGVQWTHRRLVTNHFVRGDLI